MKKSAGPQKKDQGPKVQFRAQKAILEADLRLQDQVPSDEYRAQLQDLIQHLPCPEEEKRTLLDFYTGSWPTDDDLKKAEDRAREKLRELRGTVDETQFRKRAVKQWLFITSLKLEDRCQAILAELPETAEKADFTTLINRGHAQALSTSLGAVGWSRSNQVLRRQYQQTEDKRVLGAIVGALEKRKGSLLVDLEEIPVKWVRRAVSPLGLDHIPRTGSGPRETTPAVKRTKVKQRQETYRRRDQEAEKNLRAALQKVDDRYPRGFSRAVREAVEAEKNRILTAAVTSPDPHGRNAAKKLRKERQQA